MSTINREIALQIIDGDGFYQDDTRATAIVKYDNLWGSESWAVLYPRDNLLKYHLSEACSNVSFVWRLNDDPLCDSMEHTVPEFV